MGVDIYSNDGVLVSVDEFLGSIIKKPKVKKVIAADIQKSTIEPLKKNIKNKKITFLVSDLFKNIKNKKISSEDVTKAFIERSVKSKELNT